MKKALIALSVAAGMIASAQAENTTTLYGSLGFETQVNKNSLSSLSLDENRWNLDTTTAKFGIKGTEDLSNGLQAFFKFEFGADVNGGVDNTRYAYVGLTGNFGTVTFGKQDSLYKVVTSFNDIFQNTYWGETVHFGAASGGSRIPKVISYVSPSFNGFQFGVAGILDGNNEVLTGKDDDTILRSDSSAFTAYQAGLWYNQNGFFAGLAYSYADLDEFVDIAPRPSTIRPVSPPTAPTGAYPHGSVDVADPVHVPVYAKANDNALEVVGLNVGYKNDQFKVGFGAEHQASVGERYNLAGEYYSGPNTFRAAFGVADDKGANSVYTYALGYQYNFSKRTYTYVEGDYIDWNDSDLDNGYTVRVGLRHDF